MKKNNLPRLGLFCAISLMLSYVEFLLMPSFIVPGVKLGLANLAVLIALYLFGNREALAINVVRILLCAFLFGGVSSLIYSLPAGISACFVMSLTKKSGLFTPVGVSAAGGVAHIGVQFLVGAFVLGNFSLLRLLPLATALCVLFGSLCGMLGEILIKRLPQKKL